MLKPWFAPLVLIFLLGGCADKFGYLNIQTRLDVTSIPKELHYYIISTEENSMHNPNGKLQILPSQNHQYLVFLKQQKIIKRAGNGPIVQPVGSRVVVVVCTNTFKLYPLILMKDTLNKLTITCEI